MGQMRHRKLAQPLILSKLECFSCPVTKVFVANRFCYVIESSYSAVIDSYFEVIQNIILVSTNQPGEIS